jgi:hypothetical protein
MASGRLSAAGDLLERYNGEIVTKLGESLIQMLPARVK